MSLAPSTSAKRGEVTLQPSYFTSSLFVHPYRDDIFVLINLFNEQYSQAQPPQPFALFKSIWGRHGWIWMHFKVFEARARHSFFQVSSRLFLERMVETELPLTRVVALFGLYTLFLTQLKSMPPLHSIRHIPIPLDLYTSVLSLPTHLTTPYLQPVRLHTIHILSKLLRSHVFHIVPHIAGHPLNPRELPREIFIHDEQDADASKLHDGTAPKKRGRPSKREKAKKAKDALMALDKWLEKTTYTYQVPPATHPSQVGTSSSAIPVPAPVTTHILMSHPPTTSRNNYRSRKSSLLDAISPLYPTPHDDLPAREALEKANKAVLTRLKKIDRMAAEKGLEVGSEGGERTGLERVERAIAELDNVGVMNRRGGILALLEGAGMGRTGMERQAAVADR